MSMFDSADYRWRETYFVLFNAGRRPFANQVRMALEELGSRFELGELRADPQGEFESITLSSPSDYSAMEISYLSGAEVRVQGAALSQELRGCAADQAERNRIASLKQCDGRFDIMHFEQVADAGSTGDMFDPSALLMVVAALAELTDGIGVDPQSGTIL